MRAIKLLLDSLKWRRSHADTPRPRPLPTAEFQRTLSECFCAQNTAAIERMVSQYHDAARVAVVFDASAALTAMSCSWSRTEGRGNSFTFPVFEPGRLLDTVVRRWLVLFDLFLALDQPGNSTGTVVINFNDAGIEPGLAFSGDSSGHILIPDPDFLQTRGYAKERDHFGRHQTPWEQRSAAVFWRGSSLGQKHRPIAEMPRARLCELAKGAPPGTFDVGMVDVFDVRESDAAELRAMDILKDRVRRKELHRYRYHIDIDGHANSWAGLFLKLLSAGVVLKVASPNNYRQWYYDGLKPWENFIPVRSDLSDLLEAADYCREHDEITQRIAENGRRFALSLTYETAFTSAVANVKKALAHS